MFCWKKENFLQIKNLYLEFVFLNIKLQCLSKDNLVLGYNLVFKFNSKKFKLALCFRVRQASFNFYHPILDF